MEKDIWKWFFSELSDKSLIQLVCGINETLTSKSRITIKGISDLKKIKPEQMRLFRTRIETELNKPQNTNRAKDFLRKYNEKTNPQNKEALEALSRKDTAVIWEEIQAKNSITVNEMLLYLMIQTDQMLNSKGIQIYEQIMEEVVSEQASTESLTEVEDTVFDQEERGALPNELERLREENKLLQEQTKKLQEEKKGAIKINRDLKKKISQVESEKKEANKTIQKLEQEIKTKKSDISVWNKKYQELKEELKKSQQEQEELKNKVTNLNHHLKELTEKQNELEQKGNLVSKRLVTIIDRNMPDRLKACDSTEINLISPNQLEQIILTDVLDHSDEIWFLKFKLPLQKQSLLNQKYGSKVIGFSTYNELKSYYNTY